MSDMTTGDILQATAGILARMKAENERLTAQRDTLARALKPLQETICATYCDQSDPINPHCEECVEACAALAHQDAADKAAATELLEPEDEA